MMQRILNNWKTTLAGATSIIGSVVHLWFARKTADEATWTASLTAIVIGLGLIFAGDASHSEKNAEAIDKINQGGIDPNAPTLANKPITGTGDGTSKS